MPSALAAKLSPVAGGLAREAIEDVEQSFAPSVDRVGRLEQGKRTHRARPSEAAEKEVVGIKRQLPVPDQNSDN